MTKEEAGEEILRGPYSQCIRCEGTGWREEPTPPGFVGSMSYQKCKGCDGAGRWRRGDYVRACILLGIEPVPVPTTLEDEQKSRWWNPELGEEQIEFEDHGNGSFTMKAWIYLDKEVIING